MAQTLLSFSCRLQAARIESELRPKMHFGSDTQPLEAALYVKQAGPELAIERKRFSTLYKKTSHVALEILRFEAEPCLLSLRAPLRALLRTLRAENQAMELDADNVSRNYEQLEHVADYIEAKFYGPKPFVVAKMPFMGSRRVIVRTDEEANDVVAFMNACVDAVEEACDILEEVPTERAEEYVKYLKHGD